MHFIDLKTQYSVLQQEIDTNIHTVLQHGKYIGGPEIAQLEKNLCEFTGSKYCVTCANGTDALQLALMVLGIGKGDAVFVPSFTFMSTAEVVSLVGAMPIFTDINIDTFNMDAESLENAIERTIREKSLIPKAIMPVDLFGQCADYPKIKKLAAKYHLPIIEDAAQGFGSSINGKMACSFGDISCTSFFPAKPLGCYGDGGAVFTDNKGYYDLLESTHVHGKGTLKYDNVRIGLNSRLDTIQAAVLLPKLRALREYELTDRNKWATMYTELLTSKVKTPTVLPNFRSSWAQYTIMLKDRDQRDAVQQNLEDASIPSMVYYSKPLHRQTVYLPLGYNEGSLPNAEKASERVLSLPMHPYLDRQIISKISKIILSVVK